MRMGMVVLWLALSMLAAGAGSSTPTPVPEFAPPSPERWGDDPTRVCALCGEKVADRAHSDVHRGQVVAVCGKCFGAYQANRQQVLAELQPRGALFQDEFADRRGVRWSVFALGLYLTLGLIAGALAGSAAVRRGHPGWPYVLLGVATIVVGPLLAMRLEPRPGAVSSTGWKVAATHAPVRCPRCQQLNHPSARRCSGCDGALTPTVRSEVAEPSTPASRGPS